MSNHLIITILTVAFLLAIVLTSSLVFLAITNASAGLWFASSFFGAVVFACAVFIERFSVLVASK